MAVEVNNLAGCRVLVRGAVSNKISVAATRSVPVESPK